MWSVGGNVLPLAEVDGNSSPRDLNDNMSTNPDNIQESEIESEANGMEIDAQPITHSSKGNQNDNSNTPGREMELSDASEPHDIAHLDMLTRRFYV